MRSGLPCRHQRIDVREVRVFLWVGKLFFGTILGALCIVTCDFGLFAGQDDIQDGSFVAPDETPENIPSNTDDPPHPPFRTEADFGPRSGPCLPRTSLLVLCHLRSDRICWGQ